MRALQRDIDVRGVSEKVPFFAIDLIASRPSYIVSYASHMRGLTYGSPTFSVMIGLEYVALVVVFVPTLVKLEEPPLLMFWADATEMSRGMRKFMFADQRNFS